MWNQRANRHVTFDLCDSEKIDHILCRFGGAHREAASSLHLHRGDGRREGSCSAVGAKDYIVQELGSQWLRRQC